MLRNKSIRRISILLAILLVSGSWLMHEFYVSITEVRYNPDRERFEISMRIFPDDLDRALLERSGVYTQLGTELEPRVADSLLMVYLLEEFALEVDGIRMELNYLGKEPESKSLWCYLESPRVSDPETITITSRLLTEYFPDQVNIIQVYRGKWNRGLMLDRNQQSGTLRME